MKKIKYVAFTILILALNVIFSLNVIGAQKYSIQIDGPQSAYRDSNITLTLNAKNLQGINNGFSAYSGSITYDSSKVQYVSSSGSIAKWHFETSKSEGKINFIGYDDSAPENTKRSDTELFKITFKVLNSATGNATFTVSNIKGSTEVGASLSADSISKSITITSAPVTKSNNANLSNLSVTGKNISPSFTSSNTSYKVTVPNDVTSINVNATKADSKANVQITGNNKLSVGKNNVLIEVEAEDGTKKTYKIEVTRESSSALSTPSNNQTNKKSSNNNLKEINGIDGLDFDPSKTEYDVVLPFEITKLNITATPADSKAKITYSNANINDMPIDKPYTVTIAVTAEDSSVKIYTLNVKRSSYKSDTDLKELVVNDENIYKEGKDEYTITVPSDADKLNINAIPKNDDSTVKIIGGDKLKPGNNTVVVEVTDKNGFTKSYKLNVKKESSNFLFSFLKDWWILLLIMLFILIILLILIYLHEKNKKLLEDINNKESKYIPEKIENPNSELVTHIDNNDDILYNSSNNTQVDAYVPKHLDDDPLQNILNDDSVSEVQKEIKIVRNELNGDKELEKEYKIIENYRKK